MLGIFYIVRRCLVWSFLVVYAKFLGLFQCWYIDNGAHGTEKFLLLSSEVNQII